MATASQRELFYSAGLLALVLACYSNALSCGFVFDDTPAIMENRDIRPESSIFDLVSNDFWGTPMHEERSHKSYRPLCVLTFRLNYALGKSNPWGYHLVNVVLHWAVCVLFLKASKKIMNEESSVNASLLFAVHAVHTEAVTGVVGRAELLSSIFMLLAFMAFVKAAEANSATNWNYMLWSTLFITMATVSKEQGITVVGICFIYDIFFLQKFTLRAFIQPYKYSCVKTSDRSSPIWQALRKAAPRLAFLMASSGLLLWGRMSIMGAKLPSFSRFDNPAASSAFPTRHLTYLYLLPINAWLLLYPSMLLCDWSMGTIPLVTSLSDPRNLATLLLLLCLVLLGLYAMFVEGPLPRQVIMALSFLVLPFLPASNLFFPVGFMVAERVLYTPSMGYCLLVAIAMESFQSNRTIKRVVGAIFAIILLLHAGKTIQRNSDWESGYSLYSSALIVTQQNAKMWDNVGFMLQRQNRWEDALTYHNKAAMVNPDFISPWVNIGKMCHQLDKLDEAETAFRRALLQIKIREKREKRFNPRHFIVYHYLANLIKRNESRLKEAEELETLYIKETKKLRDPYYAFIAQAKTLMLKNKFDDAESFFRQAAQLRPFKEDIHFNLGIIALNKQQKLKALELFDRVIDINPKHMMALFYSARCIFQSGNKARQKYAVKSLKTVIELDPNLQESYFILGMYADDDDDHQAAIQYYERALEIIPSSLRSLQGIAKVYMEEKRPLEAKPYLETLIQHHPNQTRYMHVLGQIEIESDLDRAQQLFQQVVDLDPGYVEAQHDLCVILMRRGQSKEAEHCLSNVLERAPHAEFVWTKRDNIRKKLAAAESETGRGEK